MLVDDDINTNIYNKIILDQANAAEEIVDFQNGKQAIDYLETGENKVDLIFLDINMPIMNGWQFLERYDQLDKEKKAGKVIVMLTASINPDDKAKALKYNIVGDFVSKPLSAEAVQILINAL
jgi:CheY-like chemotaxis protein